MNPYHRHDKPRMSGDTMAGQSWPPRRGARAATNRYEAPSVTMKSNSTRRPSPGIFFESYQCHSMAYLNRSGLEYGDKIVMPQAAFREVRATCLLLIAVRGVVSPR